jgi:trans-aconitate 2-methyltransferase
MVHEFNGEAYRQASTHQKEWGNKIISEFHFRGDEHILDLGCGDGVLTAQLAELVPHGWVLGIDASQGMIDAAVRLRAGNLDFKLQDINALDYSEEFDLVFSNAVLHWVKNHPLFLEKAYRSLKHGGIARFNFGGDGNCVHFLKVIRSSLELPAYAPFFRSFEWPWYMPAVIEYEELIRRFPFRDIIVWGEVADRYFPDEAALIKWIDQPSLVPFLEVVPIMEKEGFRQYVVEKMLEETRQADGRYFETFRRINVFARK